MLDNGWGFELFDGEVWHLHEYRYPTDEEAFARAKLACAAPYVAYRVLPPYRSFMRVYSR